MNFDKLREEYNKYEKPEIDKDKLILELASNYGILFPDEEKLVYQEMDRAFQKLRNSVYQLDQYIHKEINADVIFKRTEISMHVPHTITRFFSYQLNQNCLQQFWTCSEIIIKTSQTTVHIPLTKEPVHSVTLTPEDVEKFKLLTDEYNYVPCAVVGIKDDWIPVSHVAERYNTSDDTEYKRLCLDICEYFHTEVILFEYSTQMLSGDIEICLKCYLRGNTWAEEKIAQKEFMGVIFNGPEKLQTFIKHVQEKIIEQIPSKITDNMLENLLMPYMRDEYQRNKNELTITMYEKDEKKQSGDDFIKKGAITISKKENQLTFSINQGNFYLYTTHNCSEDIIFELNYHETFEISEYLSKYVLQFFSQVYYQEFFLTKKFFALSHALDNIFMEHGLQVVDADLIENEHVVVTILNPIRHKL